MPRGRGFTSSLFFCQRSGCCLWFAVINNVDVVSLAENVLCHFRIPVSGLMPEMHARLQHLAHGDVCHCFVSLHSEGSASSFRFHVTRWLISRVSPPLTLSGNPPFLAGTQPNGCGKCAYLHAAYRVKNAEGMLILAPGGRIPTRRARLYTRIQRVQQRAGIRRRGAICDKRNLLPEEKFAINYVFP